MQDNVKVRVFISLDGMRVFTRKEPKNAPGHRHRDAVITGSVRLSHNMLINVQKGILL